MAEDIYVLSAVNMLEEAKSGAVGQWRNEDTNYMRSYLIGTSVLACGLERC